jgi:hypothetical protein
MEWVYIDDCRLAVNVFGYVLRQDWNRERSAWEWGKVIPLRWLQLLADMQWSIIHRLSREDRAILDSINTLEHQYYRDIEHWTEAGK